MNIKARLKSAEQRLDGYTREHGHNCVCQLVHVEEGQRMSEDEQSHVERNLRCFERNNHARCHVGFSTVIVAPLRARLTVNKDEGEPLVT
jgi:hypothetical protein